MLKESRNVTNYNAIRNMDTFNARSFIKKLTKKGKKTATVKFAGNKYFKAASKKVKIKIK